METWEDIKAYVERNGNVATITMEKLRNAHGSAKLGVNVRTDISNILAGMGLGHVPVELPSYHYEQVRLYKQGMQAGNLVRMVLSPGEETDKELRAHLSDRPRDDTSVIEKIRQLVAE